MAALVTPAGCPTVSELVVQGRDSAAVLEALLRGASSPDNAGIRELAAEILLCCDRALAALCNVVAACPDTPPLGERAKPSSCRPLDGTDGPGSTGDP